MTDNWLVDIVTIYLITINTKTTILSCYGTDLLKVRVPMISNGTLRTIQPFRTKRSQVNIRCQILYQQVYCVGRGLPTY